MGALRHGNVYGRFRALLTADVLLETPLATAQKFLEFADDPAESSTP